jgi:hypothetical protein
VKRHDRPIRITITGSIERGDQIVQFAVRMRDGIRYMSGYRFPPAVLDHIPHLAAPPRQGLRRAWRALRIGFRRQLWGSPKIDRSEWFDLAR